MATYRQRRSKDKTLQLFRPPPGNEDGIQALFELKNPTKQDLLNCLTGDVDGITTRKQLTEEEERYYARRTEIYLWAAQIEAGGAQIDEHDRLVPSTGPDPLPLMNHELPRNPVHPAAEEEEERQWLQQEEQDTIMAISRAVKRYRQQGVPENEFHLIQVQPRIRDSAVNLTFRRIGFAVLAVATAFICIMLQTLPILNSFTPANPIFDKLMDELLRVRHFRLHAIHCNGLNRDDTHNWLLGHAPAINCAHGVLHIPSRTVLREEYLQSTERREMDAMEHYITGVNVSWFMPCHSVVKGNDGTHPMSPCYPGSSNECPVTSSHQCFRGVHDGWVAENDVENALRMGAALIKAGGDHFDIHENVDILDENIPRLLEKVEFLLRREYRMSQNIVPVAFRVNLALPLDARDVLGGKSSIYLSRNINKTNYVNWLDSTKRHNEDALYSIGPFGKAPIRDACNLMADMEANPRFGIHTSIFLSEGAGKDFSCGVTLYVDDHKDNSNPRHVIQRGVSIDGHRGRVVVSTGGLENRRCRLPTRAGIRAVLQIWWDCAHGEGTTSTCSSTPLH